MAATGLSQSISPAAVDGRTAGSEQVARTGRDARGRLSTGALFVVTDFALVWANAAAALWFRFIATDGGRPVNLAKNAGFLLLFSVLVVLFCNTQKLYREIQTQSALDEALAVIKAVTLAAAVLSCSVYLSRAWVVSRLVVGTTVISSAVVLVGWRYLRRRRMMMRVAAGYDCRKVLMVGNREAARAVAKHFTDNQQLGYVIHGLLAGPDQPTDGEDEGHIPSSVHELSRIVRAHFIDEVFVILPEDRELVKQVVCEARRCGVSVRIIPDLYDGLAWGAPVEHLGLFPTLQVHERPLSAVPLAIKRGADTIGSALALVLCSPLLLLVAIAVRLDSPGPVLYRSTRIGKKGKTFTCYKFRTMVQNADGLREGLRHLNERQGVLFKIADDPRLTGIGRFLRKYSLDELPQFWNVLKGDMSLVGPRPPVPGEYMQYELDHFKRLNVIPGITGLWQVEARRDPSFESYINLDNYYVDHWSFWLDLKILLKTAVVVFAGTGQ